MPAADGSESGALGKETRQGAALPNPEFVLTRTGGLGTSQPSVGVGLAVTRAVACRDPAGGGGHSPFAIPPALPGDYRFAGLTGTSGSCLPPGGQDRAPQARREQ